MWDNAKIHKDDKMVQTIQTFKSVFFVDIHYLPPYSPFLNPIEYAFGKIKSIVSSQSVHTVKELQEAISSALLQVTDEDAQGWMEHCTKYYAQATLGAPFQGKPLQPDLTEDIGLEPFVGLL